MPSTSRRSPAAAVAKPALSWWAEPPIPRPSRSSRSVPALKASPGRPRAHSLLSSARRAGRRGRRSAGRGRGCAWSSCQRHRLLPRGVVDLGAEAIPDTALGLDVDRLAWVGLDLATQAGDVHPQPFLVGFLIACPGLRQERLVGDDPAGIADEEKQQLGLGGRAGSLLALDARPL